MSGHVTNVRTCIISASSTRSYSARSWKRGFVKTFPRTVNIPQHRCKHESIPRGEASTLPRVRSTLEIPARNGEKKENVEFVSVEIWLDFENSPDRFAIRDQVARLINAVRNGNPSSHRSVFPHGGRWLFDRYEPSSPPSTSFSLSLFLSFTLSAFHREQHCDPFINDSLTRISISRDSHEPRIWEPSTHTRRSYLFRPFIKRPPIACRSLCAIRPDRLPFPEMSAKEKRTAACFQITRLSRSIIDPRGPRNPRTGVIGPDETKESRGKRE